MTYLKMSSAYYNIFKWSYLAKVRRFLTSPFINVTQATISFIIFWHFSMIYQIFLSSQVKRCAIITYKHGLG